MSSVNIFDLAAQPFDQVVVQLRAGLPARAFVDAASALNISKTVLAQKLGLAVRTIDRKRQARAALSVDESEKVLRLARIRNLARKIFTSDKAISEWLGQRDTFLNAPPLDLLDTDLGSQQVEGLLLGMAYGNVL